jgi:hypothetical protein
VSVYICTVHLCCLFLMIPTSGSFSARRIISVCPVNDAQCSLRIRYAILTYLPRRGWIRTTRSKVKSSAVCPCQSCTSLFVRREALLPDTAPLRPGTHYPHVAWAHVMLRVQLGCERRFNIEFYGADSHFWHSWPHVSRNVCDNRNLRGVLAREPTRAPREITWSKQSDRSVNLRHRIPC